MLISQPPLPPWAAINRSVLLISAITAPLLVSLYNCSSRYTDFKAFAVFPWRFPPSPGRPFLAAYLRLYRKSASVAKIIINNKTTSPPLPPSPPSGPPAATYFSHDEGNCTGAAVACLNFYFLLYLQTLFFLPYFNNGKTARVIIS